MPSGTDRSEVSRAMQAARTPEQRRQTALLAAETRRRGAALRRANGTNATSAFVENRIGSGRHLGPEETPAPTVSPRMAAIETVSNPNNATTEQMRAAIAFLTARSSDPTVLAVDRDRASRAVASLQAQLDARQASTAVPVVVPAASSPIDPNITRTVDDPRNATTTELRAAVAELGSRSMDHSGVQEVLDERMRMGRSDRESLDAHLTQRSAPPVQPSAPAPDQATEAHVYTPQVLGVIANAPTASIAELRDSHAFLTAVSTNPAVSVDRQRLAAAQADLLDQHIDIRSSNEARLAAESALAQNVVPTPAATVASLRADTARYMGAFSEIDRSVIQTPGQFRTPMLEHMRDELSRLAEDPNRLPQDRERDRVLAGSLRGVIEQRQVADAATVSRGPSLPSGLVNLTGGPRGVAPDFSGVTPAGPTSRQQRLLDSIPTGNTTQRSPANRPAATDPVIAADNRAISRTVTALLDNPARPTGIRGNATPQSRTPGHPTHETARVLANNLEAAIPHLSGPLRERAHLAFTNIRLEHQIDGAHWPDQHVVTARDREQQQAAEAQRQQSETNRIRAEADGHRANDARILAERAAREGQSPNSRATARTAATAPATPSPRSAAANRAVDTRDTNRVSRLNTWLRDKVASGADPARIASLRSEKQRIITNQQRRAAARETTQSTPRNPAQQQPASTPRAPAEGVQKIHERTHAERQDIIASNAREMGPEDAKTLDKFFGSKSPRLEELTRGYSAKGYESSVEVTPGTNSVSIRVRVKDPSATAEEKRRGDDNVTNAFSRTYVKKDDGSISVSHDHFAINPQYRSSGVGKELLSNSIRLNHELGMTHLETGPAGSHQNHSYSEWDQNRKAHKDLANAVKAGTKTPVQGRADAMALHTRYYGDDSGYIGPHAWSSMGFQWSPAEGDRIGAKFASYLTRQHGVPEYEAKPIADGLKQNPRELVSYKHTAETPNGPVQKDVGSHFMSEVVGSTGSHWHISMKDSDKGWQHMKKKLGLEDLVDRPSARR